MPCRGACRTSASASSSARSAPARIAPSRIAASNSFAVLRRIDVEIARFVDVGVAAIEELQHLALGDHVGRIGQHVEHAHPVEPHHHLERARIQEIADEHRCRVAERGVRRGAAAPQRRFVDDVVVQQRGRVDQLDDGGERVVLAPAVAAGVRRRARAARAAAACRRSLTMYSATWRTSTTSECKRFRDDLVDFGKRRCRSGSAAGPVVKGRFVERCRWSEEAIIAAGAHGLARTVPAGRRSADARARIARVCTVI